MVDTARARRLSEAIVQIVAEMLERRIKDPRLGFVTVTEARVTGDLREATVFYTVYGSDSERAESAAPLGPLKHTPSIAFEPDTVPDAARNIEELVARARMADAAVAAAREGARPAGDPDPYRVRADPDEEPDGDLEADSSAAPADGPEGGRSTDGGHRPLGDYPAPGGRRPAGA
jgi:ribosome-binding factor A